MKIVQLSCALALAVVSASCTQQGAAPAEKSGGPGVAGQPNKDVGIVQDAGTFSINVPVTETDLDRGESDTVTISLDRGDDFNQQVNLTFSGAPQGVTISPATIGADADEATVTITAGATATTGEATITVTATPAQGPPATNTFQIQVNE